MSDSGFVQVIQPTDRSWVSRGKSRFLCRRLAKPSQRELRREARENVRKDNPSHREQVTAARKAEDWGEVSRLVSVETEEYLRLVGRWTICDWEHVYVGVVDSDGAAVIDEETGKQRVRAWEYSPDRVQWLPDKTIESIGKEIDTEFAEQDVLDTEAREKNGSSSTPMSDGTP